MKIEKKDVVLFWLRRHLRELEARAEGPDQVGMAQQGYGYGQRIQATKDVESLADAMRVQIESVRSAIAFIEENG